MKNHIKILCGIIAAVFLISFFDFNIKEVSAEEDQISSLKSQQSELDKQQSELNVKLESLKGDINKKKEYRKEILAQMNTLQSQVDIESKKIDILDQEIAERETRMQGVQKEIDDNIALLCERLKVIYKAGETPELAIFMGIKSFDDFLDAAEIIQKLSKYDNDLIKNLKESISDVQQEKDLLENDKNEIIKSKSVVDEKRQDLDSLQQENERIIIDLQKEESQTKSKVNENNLKKKSLENKIAKLSNSNTGTVSMSGYKKGRYVWPVPGYSRVSSEWGDGRNHNGIDIPAPQGTKVVAMADGVVSAANSSSSWGSGWGYYVRISHGDGFETISAHLSKVYVTSGQPVKAGQVIGLVGNTGHSFGNHLHCGTAKNGRWYNPKKEL